MFTLKVVDADAFTLVIDLPLAHVPLVSGITVPAFNPQGGIYLHVYSDENRLNDITFEIQLTADFDGLSPYVRLEVPSGRDVPLVYVTLHLDSALKGTTGWTGQQKQTYGEDLSFQVTYDPDIGEINDLTTHIHIGE
jgi:hypothetical protein